MAAFTYERKPSTELRMTLPTPSFKGLAGPGRRSILGALCGCIVLPACASGPAATRMTPSSTAVEQASSAATITAITLERDCSGCPTGSRLELRRDGSVLATTTGKARRGTQDQVSRSRLAPGDFESLAQAVVTAGFFTLPESFEETGLQDGPWTTLSVARGAAVKQVFRRDEAGPPALKALEASLVALQARLVFVPETR